MISAHPDAVLRGRALLRCHLLVVTEEGEGLIISLPVRASFRGGRATVLGPGRAAVNTLRPDPSLIKAVARAHCWIAMISPWRGALSRSPFRQARARTPSSGTDHRNRESLPRANQSHPGGPATGVPLRVISPGPNCHAKNRERLCPVSLFSARAFCYRSEPSLLFCRLRWTAIPRSG